MALDRDYKIDTSSRQCAACGRPFDVGETYVSAVVETGEEDRFERRDFCDGCWQPDGAYFSFWRTRVPPPEPEGTGPRLADLDRLMRLFERLGDETDDASRRFRYVLALALMRKRRLKLSASRRLPDGGEELTVRVAGTDTEFAVVAPRLTEDEVLAVADRLREILDIPESWEARDAGTDDTTP